MVATFRDVLVESVESRSGRAPVYYSWAYIELRAPRSALGHIEPSSASLTMRAPCRRRPRSRRYGARASNSALASLECIQSLIIRCCLMHSATCSHPWRREVNRKCVVSIDTSILPRAACACEHNHNVPACLLSLSGWLILSSLPQESSIAWGTTCPTRQSKVPPTSGSRKVALRHHRPKSCESLEDGRIGVPKHRFRAFLMRIHRVAMAQAFVHFPVHLLASWVRHFDQQRRQNHRLTFLAFSQKCQKCQK